MHPSVLQADGQVYVRPHDIEVLRHSPKTSGVVAVVRYIHAAGALARLTLEQTRSQEMVEAEISRSELARLNLNVGDLACLRLRQAHSFEEDYTI